MGFGPIISFLVDLRFSASTNVFLHCRGIGVSFSYKNTGEDFQPRSTNHDSAAQNSVRILVLAAKEEELPDRCLFVVPSPWHKAPFRTEHETPSET